VCALQKKHDFRDELCFVAQYIVDFECVGQFGMIPQVAVLDFYDPLSYMVFYGVKQGVLREMQNAHARTSAQYYEVRASVDKIAFVEIKVSVHVRRVCHVMAPDPGV